jgi:hypothetical protein
MHRLIVCATLTCALLAAAACGSDSTSPKDTFSGTWNGTVYLAGSSSSGDTIYVHNLIVTQTGSAFSGTGIGASGGDSTAIDVHGTVALPNVSGWLVIPSGSDSVQFTGAFVNADSISASVTAGSQTLILGIKK